MGKGVSILQTVVTNFFRRSLGRQCRGLVDEVNKFQVFVPFSLPPFFCHYRSPRNQNNFQLNTAVSTPSILTRSQMKKSGISGYLLHFVAERAGMFSPSTTHAR
jgi:hypothetical protein